MELYFSFKKCFVKVFDGRLQAVSMENKPVSHWSGIHLAGLGAFRTCRSLLSQAEIVSATTHSFFFFFF